MTPLKNLKSPGFTLMILFLSGASAMAQLTYEGRLGFIDPLHTRDNGSQFSQVTGAAGEFFRGTSTRYNGGSPVLGATAWIANSSGSTTQVGLYDGIFGTVFQNSAALHVAASGVSAGRSGYYTNYTGHGTATWRATSDGATVWTGLTTALYTRDDGYRSSSVQGLTASGFSYGTSDVYNGGSALLGKVSWVAGPVSNNRVAFSGSLFVGDIGQQNSTIAGINSAGSTVGSATRYNGGSVTTGQSAFRSVANGSSSQVGLYDGSHIRNDGYVFSEGLFISENGYAAGHSNRYSGPTSEGKSAWRADASGTTSRIGYYTPEYATGNYYSSEVTGLLSNGSAIGVSIRNSSGAAARTGWIVDTSGNYRDVGLSGLGHTNEFGYSSNRPTLATDSGFVAGRTTRFSPTNFTFQGYSAFVEDLNPGGGAVQVGLYDAAHTRGDGSIDNDVRFLTADGGTSGTVARNDGGTSVWAARADGTSYQLGNYGAGFELTNGLNPHYDSQLNGMSESGYVWGISVRSAGGNSAGYAGWLFSLDSATQINLSDYDVLTPAGYGTSAFRGVNADGVAFGNIQNGLRTEGFIWSEALGFVSVGDAVDGGIAQYDWDSFQTAFAGTDGIIAGSGLLQDGSTGAYLVAPEPSTAVLVGLGIAGLLARRRRDPARALRSFN